MQRALAETEGLQIVEGEAHDLVVERGRVAGLALADGRTLRAGAVALTTGTLAWRSASWMRKPPKAPIAPAMPIAAAARRLYSSGSPPSRCAAWVKIDGIIR